MKIHIGLFQKRSGKYKMKKEEKLRPYFLTALSDAYNFKRKNIITLTGDINGLFFNIKNSNFI